MKKFIDLAKKEGFDFVVDKQNDCFEILENNYSLGIFSNNDINNLIKELKESIMDCDMLLDFYIIEAYQSLIKLAIKAKQMEA